MSLTSDDRAWLEAKFERVHERVDEVWAAFTKERILMAEVKGKSEARDTQKCPSVTKHEEAHHDAKKTWGVIGAIVATFVGLMELIKWVLSGTKH